MNVSDYLKAHEGSGIKVGDIVKVVRPAVRVELGWWKDSWSTVPINKYVGHFCEVVADLRAAGFKLRFKDEIMRDGGGFVSPYFVLEVQEPVIRHIIEDKDYSGCNPIIAEALKQGKKILCKADHYAIPLWVIAFDDTQDVYYTQGGIPLTNAEPVHKPKTEIRVKKASKIMKWLEENDYIIDIQGNSYNPPPCGTMTVFNTIIFFFGMFEHCGKSVDNHYKWHKDWLEEVVIE
jgi:hypothetical protein